MPKKYSGVKTFIDINRQRLTIKCIKIDGSIVRRRFEESLVRDAERYPKYLSAIQMDATDNMPQFSASDERLFEDSIAFHYQSIFSVGLEKHIANLLSLLALSGLNVLRMNQNDVIRELSEIKTPKFFELNGLYPRLIKELVPVLACPITEIFRLEYSMII